MQTLAHRCQLDALPTALEKTKARLISFGSRALQRIQNGCQRRGVQARHDCLRHGLRAQRVIFKEKVHARRSILADELALWQFFLRCVMQFGHIYAASVQTLGVAPDVVLLPSTLNSDAVSRRKSERSGCRAVEPLLAPPPCPSGPLLSSSSFFPCDNHLCLDVPKALRARSNLWLSPWSTSPY